MRSATTILILLISLMLSGCQEERESLIITNPDSGTLVSYRPGQNIWNPGDPIEQQTLSDIWNSANHNQWDIIEVVVNLANGGIVSGTPESWPAGFEFSVEIPEGTVAVGEYGKLLTPRGKDINPLVVNIQILVPKAITQLQVPVYKLRPDLEFNQPVKVTFCYPPWQPVAPNQEYTKYCIHKSYDDPSVYFMTDLGILQSIDPQPRATVDPHTNIRFQTFHFSRWVLKKGHGAP